MYWKNLIKAFFGKPHFVLDLLAWEFLKPFTALFP